MLSLIQDEISLSLKSHLQEVMTSYGISILNALVTDLTPDHKVRDAMNEINASKRLKEVCHMTVYVLSIMPAVVVVVEVEG